MLILESLVCGWFNEVENSFFISCLGYSLKATSGKNICTKGYNYYFLNAIC